MRAPNFAEAAGPRMMAAQTARSRRVAASAALAAARAASVAAGRKCRRPHQPRRSDCRGARVWGAGLRARERRAGRTAKALLRGASGAGRRAQTSSNGARVECALAPASPRALSAAPSASPACFCSSAASFSHAQGQAGTQSCAGGGRTAQ